MSTTIKILKGGFNYYEGIKAKILSLKENIENKKNEELPQAYEKQENEILKLRHQVEEGRKAKEKEEKY